MRSIETDIQIRFADIDILGHVNNVNLQHYFDLGKSDYFHRAMGLAKLPTGVYPIIAATQIDYHAQTLPDERIYVETALEKVGTKSLTLLQRVVSRNGDEVKATSRSVMVAFDFGRQESVPVPTEWRIYN